MKILPSMLLSGLAVCAPVALQAQNYSIDWHVISSGGGTSVGSNGTNTFSVSGTIGQPAGATMSGGNYSLTSGFWSLLSAVQSPGAPTLSIKASGNTAIVSWSSASTGFSLQQSSTLSPSSWLLSTTPLTTNGSVISASIAITNGGHQYFRLISQ